jgi:hypothetical protein
LINQDDQNFEAFNSYVDTVFKVNKDVKPLPLAQGVVALMSLRYKHWEDKQELDKGKDLKGSYSSLSDLDKIVLSSTYYSFFASF